MSDLDPGTKVRKPRPRYGYVPHSFKFKLGDMVAHKDELQNFGEVVKRTMDVDEDMITPMNVYVVELDQSTDYPGYRFHFAEDILVEVKK